jgi:hypothetical protein
MPKLNEHTLEKMFPCGHCDELFRTRQGLSGHIQWKHKVEQDLSMRDTSSIIKWATQFESVSKVAGLSQSRSKAQAHILARWTMVTAACDVLKIKPNNQDFKNYIITSLARMYENENLEERLINRIRALFDEYKLIS